MCLLLGSGAHTTYPLVRNLARLPSGGRRAKLTLLRPPLTSRPAGGWASEDVHTLRGYAAGRVRPSASSPGLAADGTRCFLLHLFAFWIDTFALNFDILQLVSSFCIGFNLGRSSLTLRTPIWHSAPQIDLGHVIDKGHSISTVRIAFRHRALI